MSGRQVNNTGTNSQGNQYTSYTDGAYRYANTNSSGARDSTYFDTGRGHGFYQGREGGFHENQNTGVRTSLPGRAGGEGTRHGVNSQGNEYTSYPNGGFRYTNRNEEGGATSRYFDTGAGHAFYKGPEYTFHENQNQGFRDYKPRK